MKIVGIDGTGGDYSVGRIESNKLVAADIFGRLFCWDWLVNTDLFGYCASETLSGIYSARNWTLIPYMYISPLS